MQDEIVKTYPMKVLTAKGWIIKPKAGSEMPGYYMNEVMADRALELMKGKRAEWAASKKGK